MHRMRGLKHNNENITEIPYDPLAERETAASLLSDLPHRRCQRKNLGS